MYIEVSDAVKQYGTGSNVVYAMNGVNFEMAEHNICVILGPSGSGKSTLLNMLGGIDSLTSGTIKIDGQDISHMNTRQLTDFRRKEIGFIFQSYNLIPDLTVYENVQTVADISKEPLDIHELLTELEMLDYKNYFPRELSGGQQQRTAIARALVKNPALLLCDEPTGALDSKSSRDVLRMIEKINRRYQTTILMITHNEGISKMADQIIRIHDGKIVESIENANKIQVEELMI